MGSEAFAFTNSKGVKYFLNGKMVSLKSGRQQQIYYFSRDERTTTLSELPDGYQVVETTRTGMPVLKKI